MKDDFGPEIFLSNKWSILKEIAEYPQSPSDLALKTNTSLSNITQQLKILEAYRIVRREKSNEKNSGKPRTIYYLTEEMVYGMILKNGMAERKTFYVDNNNKLFFNILFTMESDDLMFMLKFHFKYEEVLRKCKAIGFIKSSRESIELFLLTDHLDEIRSKFSNIFIDDNHGKIKKIINWTHNDLEITDGLHRKDRYFMDMMKLVQPIHDPDNTLRRYKNIRNT
ncbi:MAG TPA: helix-turn-helix domain-containing protein [Alphaproteobacteria bacterium]|nr:helix-turn-helix domain-containing protein [Alphaproteobacteria bacterium]